MNNRFCTYLRVSTQKQGSGGLGIEAQRKMCSEFIKRNNGESEQEFMDVESGTHRDRKGLWQAIDYCKNNKVGLVIAKLDRLARDVEFTFKVMNTGIDIHFTDMPVVNSMILGVFASVAQYEREMCSSRTKQALGELKRKGVKLGRANETYKNNYNKKTNMEKRREGQRKGLTKNARHLEGKQIQAFIKVLKSVFPEATAPEDMMQWNWKGINTKKDNRDKVLKLMIDYKALDNTLFRNWKFQELDDKQFQMKLASHIANLHRSVKTREYLTNIFNNQNNSQDND